MKTFDFIGLKCFCIEEKYANNNRIALMVYNADTIDEDGIIYEPGTMLICTATTNVVDVMIADDEVIIKTYSENEGLIEEMIKAGIVMPTGRHIATGFVNVPICKYKGV